MNYSSVIHGFTIGPHQLENGLILAPMAGITDRPFRHLCRQLGAGLAVAEMLTSDTSLWHTPKSQRRLPHADDSTPISVQIAGSDPVQMAHAAHANVALGAQIIDINMGCPAKKVCKRAAGSALLQYPELVSDILKATVSAVDVPVTLKIRTGWDRQNRNAVTIAKIAEEAGVASLAVHGRTKACRFVGEVEYDTIAQVVEAVSIPVLANGDINDPQKAVEVLKHTGAAAVMIGRAAQGNPWIFSQINHYLKYSQPLAPPSMAECSRVMSGHLLALHEFYGEAGGLRISRKHIGWYINPMAGGKDFTKQFNALETTEQQRQLLNDFFLDYRSEEQVA